ncbi:MAG TPA: glutathione S-transferase [Paracoccaceae bacterium]|nr:glutathione S-transferase [Paracoccaceae bacterium]
MQLPQPVRYYHTPRAPNPRRTDIFLAEKGVEVERVPVDLLGGAHKAGDYLAKAGVPQVPALELSDGTVLVEVPAICRYIEALTPEPNMLGRDPLEAAVIEMWQRRIELRLMMVIAFCFRHTNPHMAALEEQCPDWGAVNAGRIDERLAELDRRLDGHEWIAADRLTIADITGVVAVDFLRILKREVPEEMKALRDWHARMKARPSTAMK